MRQLLLLPFALAACSAQSATSVSARTSDDLTTQKMTATSAALSSSLGVEHNVSGSGVQKLGPGFEYAVSVSVHSDRSGRVSGTINTHIIDLSAYGYPGKPEILAEATCMRLVDRSAYINAVVTRSSDPNFAPIGSRVVFWVHDAGENGADIGRGGPGAVLDPTNLICTSTPPKVSTTTFATGNFVVR